MHRLLVTAASNRENIFLPVSRCSHLGIKNPMFNDIELFIDLHREREREKKNLSFSFAFSKESRMQDNRLKISRCKHSFESPENSTSEIQ